MRRFSVSLAAVVLGLITALSAVNVAVAARGGRAPGGGEYRGNEGGGHPVQHTPSFSQPPRNEFRPAGPSNVEMRRPGGERPNTFQRPNEMTATPGGAGRGNLPPRQTFECPQTFAQGHPGAGPENNPALQRNNTFERQNFNRENLQRDQLNVNRGNFDRNRENFGGNNFERNNINNFTAINNTGANRYGMGGFANHPGNRYGDWYHGNWHGHWGPSWGSYPAGWGYGYGGYGGYGRYGGYGAGYAGYGGSGLGYGYGPYAGYGLAGLAAAGLINAAAPWNWGYYGYSNPYYNGTTNGGWNGYNYSQPLAFAQTPLDPTQAAAGANAQVAQAAVQPNPNDIATSNFDAARDAFKQGNYAAALKLIDGAIAGNPSDPVMHEFRALCQFAIGDYQQAAATLYAVLSVGPGWDWTTVANLYPSVDAYTQQLRALEAYRQTNPAAADARFVLAYQYLLQGYTDPAANELKAVVQIQPNNQLAAQLLKSVASPNAALAATGVLPTPAPSPAAAPAEQPAAVNPSVLPGNWQATGPDGAKFALDITKDGNFNWRFARDGKTQDIKGDYKVQDNNFLVLQGADNNNLVGQIAMLPNNQMKFKLAGENPSDPGLTFKR